MKQNKGINYSEENRKYEEMVRREATLRKAKRAAFLSARDAEYARLFPQNLKHGKYNGGRYE